MPSYPSFFSFFFYTSKLLLLLKPIFQILWPRQLRQPQLRWCLFFRGNKPSCVEPWSSISLLIKAVEILQLRLITLGALC